MRSLRTLVMALPIVAMALPAVAATDLTGDWTVTLTTVRPAQLQGVSACFTLTQTGAVNDWSDSGTFTIAGTSVQGQYYAINSVLTAYAFLPNSGFLLLTGHLYQKNISNTSFLEIVGGSPATGNFTAVSGCG
jgi:hypothetical protein